MASNKSSQRQLQENSTADRSLPWSQKDCDFSSDQETCQVANHCCATIAKNSQKQMVCVPQAFHNQNLKQTKDTAQSLTFTCNFVPEETILEPCETNSDCKDSTKSCVSLQLYSSLTKELSWMEQDQGKPSTFEEFESPLKICSSLPVSRSLSTWTQYFGLDVIVDNSIFDQILDYRVSQIIAPPAQENITTDTIQDENVEHKEFGSSDDYQIEIPSIDASNDTEIIKQTNQTSEANDTIEDVSDTSNATSTSIMNHTLTNEAPSNYTEEIKPTEDTKDLNLVNATNEVGNDQSLIANSSVVKDHNQSISDNSTTQNDLIEGPDDDNNQTITQQLPLNTNNDVQVPSSNQTVTQSNDTSGELDAAAPPIFSDYNKTQSSELEDSNTTSSEQFATIPEKQVEQLDSSSNKTQQESGLQSNSTLIEEEKKEEQQQINDDKNETLTIVDIIDLHQGNATDIQDGVTGQTNQTNSNFSQSANSTASLPDNNFKQSPSTNSSVDNHTSADIPLPSSQMNSEEESSNATISPIVETVSIFFDNSSSSQANDTKEKNSTEKVEQFESVNNDTNGTEAIATNNSTEQNLTQIGENQDTETQQKAENSTVAETKNEILEFQNVTQVDEEAPNDTNLTEKPATIAKDELKEPPQISSEDNLTQTNKDEVGNDTTDSSETPHETFVVENYEEEVQIKWETRDENNQGQGDQINESSSIDIGTIKPFENITEENFESSANTTVNITVLEVQIVAQTENQTDQDMIEVNSTIQNLQIEVSYQSPTLLEPSESSRVSRIVVVSLVIVFLVGTVGGISYYFFMRYKKNQKEKEIEKSDTSYPTNQRLQRNQQGEDFRSVKEENSPDLEAVGIQ